MGKSRSQDIIETLLGRGHSAPEAYVQGRWASWMRLRPRPVPARRDAVLAVLAARPLSRPLPPPRRPHWWALLCWQMGPEPLADQRWQRRMAALFSVGLHGLFVLLLVSVALLRSAPQASEPVQRVALRFVSAGQGHEHGHEHGQVQASADAAAGAPAGASAGAQADAGQRAIRRSEALPVGGPLPEPAPAPAPVADTALVVSRAAVEPAPAPLPAPVAATVAVAAQAAQSRPAPVQQEPEQALTLPAPPLRPIRPRAVDFALEAEVSLPVVERELELAERLAPRPVRPVQVDAVPLALPEVRVAERRIELRQTAPAVGQPALASASVRPPAVAEAEVALREREVTVLQPAPALPGLRQPVVSGRPPSAAAELAVAEREISPAGTAPALRGVRPAAVAVDVAPTAVPTVVERQVSGREPAPVPAGVRAGLASPDVSVPAASALAVHERTLPGRVPVADQSASADAGGAVASQPAATATAAAGSAQDWSRGAAGDDDWSRPGRVEGQAHARAAGGLPSGLRAAGLPATPPVRGAPGGDSDQWTRQRLEAGGTWLRRPPPGHAPGRFDRYWVPNESLLAEWVRQGIKNVNIPLPGGSGSISCVISLLQVGGGCGVTDPNMQEQPAQARAAPDIPFKPALHNDSGSP